jgi:hypothetical protein
MAWVAKEVEEKLLVPLGIVKEPSGAKDQFS